MGFKICFQDNLAKRTSLKINEKKIWVIKEKEIAITIICKISFNLHIKITGSLNYARVRIVWERWFHPSLHIRLNMAATVRRKVSDQKQFVQLRTKATIKIKASIQLTIFNQTIKGRLLGGDGVALYYTKSKRQSCR